MTRFEVIIDGEDDYEIFVHENETFAQAFFQQFELEEVAGEFLFVTNLDNFKITLYEVDQDEPILRKLKQ